MNFPQLDFNCAVMQMAMHLMPCGWDVVPESEAPDTLDKLIDLVAKTGRIAVSDAHSEHTIFADPAYNYAFRAWHDWTHWRYRAPFTLEGERDTAAHQIIDIGRIFGYGQSFKKFAELIAAEVAGQAEYFEKWGEFPQDQVAFVNAYMEDKEFCMWKSPDMYRIQ